MQQNEARSLRIAVVAILMACSTIAMGWVGRDDGRLTTPAVRVVMDEESAVAVGGSADVEWWRWQTAGCGGCFSSGPSYRLPGYGAFVSEEDRYFFNDTEL